MSVEYESNKMGRTILWHRDYVDYPPHFHESIELIAVDRGSCSAYVDFKEYELKAGDVFIAFPNLIHSYSKEDNIRCYTFIFPSSICPELMKMFETKVPVDPVIRAEQGTESIFYAMESLYKYSKNNDQYSKLIKKGYFMVLLSTILSRLSLVDIPMQNPSAERRIINYCLQHFRSRLTLEVLSRELYISRHHISHLFSSKMKIGFNEFLNQLRVKDACDRLDQGESITKAAFDSGFSSIRTFNRAFLNEIGVNPTEYVKNKVEKADV